MPIGTSKVGALGGLVPGGTETFNAPGTFSVPPGVKKVSITGKGGTGNPGNPGNPGNAGTAGTGGSGGGGGGGTSSAANCGDGLSARLLPFRNQNWPGGSVPPTVLSGGGRGNTPGASGQAGQSGQSGCAGQAGQAGNAGTAGNSSSGLGNTFPGGAGGNAGAAGNAGTGGTGGGGGGGGTGAPPGGPGSGGSGGTGAQSGKSGSPQIQGAFNNIPPTSPSSSGGGGGGGAGSAGNAFNFNCNGIRPIPERGNINPVRYPAPQIPSGFGNILGGIGGAGNVVRSGNTGGPSPVPWGHDVGSGGRARGGVGAATFGDRTQTFTNGWNQYLPAAPLDFGRGYSTFVPSPPGPPNGYDNRVSNFQLNTEVITYACNAFGLSRYTMANLTDATANFSWGNVPAPERVNVARGGAGGGGGGCGTTPSVPAPTAWGGGGGGGGGRGNAGGAGGTQVTGGSGSAATPQTFNCVTVTPGATVPITVASPGGQIVISWNPQ